MNNNRITCDPKRIELFLQQKLSDEEQTAFELHLDDCHDCRRQLEATAASDDIWSGVRDSLLGQQLPPDGLRSGGSTLDFTTGGDASFSHTTVLKLLAPTDDDRMLGRLGTYEVMGVIGSGGMGVVLKAFDAALNRNVAIKVLAPHLGSSGAARKRFSREAQAAAAVVHDNVMEIYGVADVDGLPYLVMPYVRGPSLQRRLDDDGPLALVEILRIGMQAAAGLAAAHAQGLVHRDVKPANILLADGVERVKLTDFGLARAADDASLTKTGIIAGTPQYMSPEQSRGESVDQRSDLFSLGSVLYAMCTGRAPFRAETSYGVLRRVTDEEPRPIREINPDIPEWLCRIIATLMSKQPDDRFASAREVAELLEECLAHVQQPTAVPLPASLVPLSMSSRFLSISHRSLGVIAMIATFALGLAGFIFWQPAQAPDTPGSRSTPGSVAAEPAPLVFGPAIERVIAMPDADDQGMVFFDLETGKSFKPPFPLMFYPKTGPAFVELTPELVQWIKARDVDLLCHLVGKNWDIMTLGMQENYAGELKEWETLSPDEVVRMLAEMDAEPPVRDEDPSSSFGHSSQDGIGHFTAFMTRSNTMGVYRLEDVDMSKSTSLGVRIRYKLVPEAAKPAPLVFGPAIERVIAMPDADDQGMVFFDLETGKSFKPPFPLKFYPKTGPAFVELTPELVQWIKARDVDLLCHLVEKNWDIMTLGMQENYAGELNEWETLSPKKVVRIIAEMDAELPVRDEDPSSSFGHSSQDDIGYFIAFMTRSNTMGVYRLEDVDMSKSTSLGVRIRYKLVQMATGPNARALPGTPGSRSTPGSVAAEPAPLVFGPAIERVIAMPDADDQGMVFFDLETGKSFKPPFPLMFYPKTGPAFVELTPELVQWIKARDVDLLCHLVEKNWDIMTLGMQENYAGELKEWETLSPDEVVRMLAEMDAEPPVRDEDPSSSFGHSSQDGIAYFTAFMTRSNTMGVYRLEDVDMSRSTSLGVRIRYKLVQGVIPDESKPTVAQLTELGARRIAKGTRGTWSPDGKRIALGKMPFGSGIAVVEVTGVASDSPSPTSGTRPTFVLDAEIGSVRDLVVDGKDPAFSPDGKRVAFTREVAEGPPKEEIWLGAVDELMKDKTSMRRLGAGVMATWSADASTVFFSNPQTREIFSVRTDQPDAEPAVMWKAVGDLFPDLWYPVVAPDGRRVAYHADGQLKIADMTSQTIVGSWPLDGWHGFLGGWSPDGSQLGYGAFGGEDKGLWLLRFPMAVEGNLFHYGKPIVPKPTRLLDGSCTSPSWSPDGSKLAFDFRSPERGYEVWMVDAKAIDNLLGIIITGQADEIITGQADERAESMNHLKQIGLAVHIYHDAYGTFPPAYRAENSGRPLLSWRVLILPYLGQEALYRHFTSTNRGTASTTAS